MTGKQRSLFRAEANTLQAILQIGKGGVEENLVKQVDDALEARELIKIKALETCPDDAKTAASLQALLKHMLQPAAGLSMMISLPESTPI